MRLLLVFTQLLIRAFNISNKDYSYRHLMLIVSLGITIVGFSAFALKSYSTHSVNLAYVLTLSSILSLLNLLLLRFKTSFKFSSYFFIIVYLLTMSYVVIDSGRSGYGFLWFLAIPIVNISILGIKRGTVFSFLFQLYLIIMFNLPSYYISVEYNSELKPRLLSAFFAIILLILFREWTIDFFKKQRKIEVSLAEEDIEFKKVAIRKLSNQIRYVTNDIFNSVKQLKKGNPKPQFLKSINAISESSLNLININNSLGEFSEINLNENKIEDDYNLLLTVENTVNLFSSYGIDIKVNIEEELPRAIYGDSLLIKQIIYTVIENFINDNLANTKKIDIHIYKGSESISFLEIKYQIVNILVDKENYQEHQDNCKQVELYPVKDDIIEIEKMGLSSLFTLVEKLNGSISLRRSNSFSSICFNHRLPKDDNFKKAINLDTYISTGAGSDVFDELSKKKLNKMRVLLMEDNPITQKTILFTLDKVVKHIDVANNGKEGLELFNSKQYDLILLDINMPILDGYEVARRIRNIEQGTRFHVLIIAVISDFLARDIENILTSGVDDYISKPLKTNDLISKLNSISQKKKRKTPNKVF